MKVKIIFSALMMIGFLSLHAQGTLKGTIKDAKTGELLPFVSVVVEQNGQRKGGGTSDMDGVYTIKPLSPGSYVVKATFVGYVPIMKIDVNVKGSGFTVEDLELTPMAMDMKEVEIVETKVKMTDIGNPAQGTTLSGKDIERMPATTADGIAAITAGISYNDGGKGSARGESSMVTIVGNQYNPQNNEEYKSFRENIFISTKKEPLSTFSIDVDAASYSNMRRYLNLGQKPPQDALRTEELINYFSYIYPQPTENDPVKILNEVGECPWNTAHRLVRIGIKAKEIPSKDLPASNLVFLIDVSGSMYGPTRLELVKASLKLLADNLREKDKVAIVVYAGAAGEVLPSTSGSDKQKIKDALEILTAGGSTAGAAGIQMAYEIAKKNFISNGNNRIVLCTDGDFNVGISDPEKLEKLIETERKSGIYLTILGYGMGNYKDNRIQILAEKGNGNHAYIDNLQEAKKVLVGEFGGTLYTVANDVKLQIEFNPAFVQSYRLIGYESRLLNKEDFNDDKKDAGEIGAGQTVTAFYEIVPAGTKENIPNSVDDLKYQNKESSEKMSLTNSPELLTVKLRYKLPNKNNSIKLEVPLTDKKTNNVSDDFRFASAVAMFGQILRGSDYIGNATYDDVISLAKQSLGNDEQGYRHEFIRLVEVAKGL